MGVERKMGWKRKGGGSSETDGHLMKHKARVKILEEVCMDASLMLKKK